MATNKKVTSAADAARAAERRLTEAVEHFKQLKAKSREGKQLVKKAKKSAKAASKAARAARKAAEQARREFRKARERADKERKKTAKARAPIVTPKRRPTARVEATSTRRRRLPQRPGARIGEVGEDTIDSEVAELPELGAEVTAIRG
jgi:chromosome segregation ATPase